jgi:hypothetical protein
MMVNSTDERISRFLKKHEMVDESKAPAEERTREVRDAEEMFLTKVRAKWAEDTLVINLILSDLTRKLVRLSPQFQLSDMGSPPAGTAAIWTITGHLANNQVAIDLRLGIDGVLYGAQRAEYPNSIVGFVGDHKIEVLAADKERYEDLILKLVGID